MSFWKGLKGEGMGKINVKLLQGIEDAENQIQKEKQPQGVRRDLQESQSSQSVSKPSKSTKKSKKTENKPNTKPQKQVFSFRALTEDISIWKAYSTATGKTMEKIGTAALNEYIKRHKLNEAEKAVFDALGARGARE